MKILRIINIILGFIVIISALAQFMICLHLSITLNKPYYPIIGIFFGVLGVVTGIVLIAPSKEDPDYVDPVMAGI